MRILFTTTPGVGHLLPLLPLARTARERGHEVRIAAGASLAPIIASAGFRHEPMGPASIGEVVARVPELRGLTGRRRAPVTLQRVFCEVIAPEMTDGIAALVATWRPDILVHEDLEFGAWLVGEQLGIAHVTVQATAWRPASRRAAAKGLDPLRDRQGLAPVDEQDRMLGQAFFTTRPRSLRDPEVPLPTMTAELRPIADDRRDPDPGASPFPPRDDRRRVAITLGTINNGEEPILRALIDGAVATGAHVVVALGADPASLGSVPPEVDVHRYVPMSSLLPEADVVAFHGGSGTMLAALAAARPMVIVPLAADQPDNADLCEQAGVGRTVPLETATADTVHSALAEVLGQPSYRRRAAEVAAEIAAMPGPDAALDRIESIVATR